MALVNKGNQIFDRDILENIILRLADVFQIKIVWDRDTAVMTGAFALAGGLVGGYAGGRMGAAIGAGIGTVTGFGASTLVTLREIWITVREKLTELLYIVFNFLQRIDPLDYIAAIEILMASRSSRKELVLTMLEFIAQKLGHQVISSITMA